MLKQQWPMWSPQLSAQVGKAKHLPMLIYSCLWSTPSCMMKLYMIKHILIYSYIIIHWLWLLLQIFTVNDDEVFKLYLEEHCSENVPVSFSFVFFYTASQFFFNLASDLNTFFPLTIRIFRHNGRCPSYTFWESIWNTSVLRIFVVFPMTMLAVLNGSQST